MGKHQAMSLLHVCRKCCLEEAVTGSWWCATCIKSLWTRRAEEIEQAIEAKLQQKEDKR